MELDNAPEIRQRFRPDSGLGDRMAQRPARLTRCGEVLHAADRSVIDNGDQTFEGVKLSFFKPNQSVESVTLQLLAREDAHTACRIRSLVLAEVGSDGGVGAGGRSRLGSPSRRTSPEGG